MIDQLKSIGIEKGKAFTPDVATQEALKAAALEARAWLDLQYEAVFTPPFNEGSHWALPASPAVVEGMSTNLQSPTPIPWTVAASAIPWPISAPSIWARASSI